jgi:hypothetical protein
MTAEGANDLIDKLEVYQAIKYIQEKGILNRSVGASLSDEPAIVIRKCIKALAKHLFPTCELRMISRGVQVTLNPQHSKMLCLVTDYNLTETRNCLEHIPELRTVLHTLNQSVGSISGVITTEVVSRGTMMLTVKAGMESLRTRRGAMFDYLYMMVEGMEQLKSNLDAVSLAIPDIEAAAAQGSALKREAERIRDLEISREVDDVLSRLTGVTYGQGIISEESQAAVAEVATTDTGLFMEPQIPAANHDDDEADMLDFTDRAEAREIRDDVVDVVDDDDVLDTVESENTAGIRLQRQRQANTRMANADEMARLNEIMRRQGLI